MRKPIIILVSLLLLATYSGLAQNERPSQETLSDLSTRVMAEIRNFQDFVSLIAEGSAPERVKKNAIDKTLELFASNATIQEKGKYSGRERTWEVDQYMWAIYSRGERAPVLINFEMIDELNADELEPVPQPDGSTIYRGTLVFKQFYCRLKQVEELVEVTSSEPNVNCAYDDITEKEVTVEIKRSTSVKGQFWVTLFTKVRVLRVY